MSDQTSIDQQLAAMQQQIDYLTAQLNKHLGPAPGLNTLNKPHPKLILRSDAYQLPRYM